LELGLKISKIRDNVALDISDLQ